MRMVIDDIEQMTYYVGELVDKRQAIYPIYLTEVRDFDGSSVDLHYELAARLFFWWNEEGI